MCTNILRTLYISRSLCWELLRLTIVGLALQQHFDIFHFQGKMIKMEWNGWHCQFCRYISRVLHFLHLKVYTFEWYSISCQYRFYELINVIHFIDEYEQNEEKKNIKTVRLIKMIFTDFLPIFYGFVFSSTILILTTILNKFERNENVKFYTEISRPIWICF